MRKCRLSAGCLGKFFGKKLGDGQKFCFSGLSRKDGESKSVKVGSNANLGLVAKLGYLVRRELEVYNLAV